MGRDSEFKIALVPYFREPFKTETATRNMGFSQGIGLGLLGLVIGGLAFFMAIGASEGAQGFACCLLIFLPPLAAAVGFLIPSKSKTITIIQQAPPNQ